MKRLLTGLLALLLLATPVVAQQNTNGGIYQVTPDTLVDGQRGPLLTDANRKLVTTPGTPGASTSTKTEDAPSANGDVGIPAMCVRNSAFNIPVGTDGDYSMISCGQYGGVYIDSVIPATGAQNLGKSEDAGHTSGDTGVLALGVRNDTAATFCGTDLDYCPLATTLSGATVIAQGVGRATPGDAVSNANILVRTMDVAGNTGYLGVLPYQFNGTTWDRIAGNTAGQFIQGAVASGSADSGNPAKFGCKYNASAPTFTDLNRGDCQIDTSGNIRVQVKGVSGTGSDGVANTNNIWMPSGQGDNATQRLPVTGGMAFNSSTWDRVFTCPNTAVVNVTAAATTQIVALASSQIIRVCSIAISMSAAGTAKFVYGTGSNCGTGTTDITGAMSLATGTPLSISAANGSVLRTIASNALCVAAVTGNVVGWITYAQY